MNPYRTIKLTQWPDVSDLKAEGRPTHLGRMDGRSIFRRSRIKRATRRILKHRDKAKQAQEEARIAALEAKATEQELQEVDYDYDQNENDWRSFPYYEDELFDDPWWEDYHEAR